MGIRCNICNDHGGIVGTRCHCGGTMRETHDSAVSTCEIDAKPLTIERLFVLDAETRSTGASTLLSGELRKLVLAYVRMLGQRFRIHISWGSRGAGGFPTTETGWHYNGKKIWEGTLAEAMQIVRVEYPRSRGTDAELVFVWKP